MFIFVFSVLWCFQVVTMIFFYHQKNDRRVHVENKNNDGSRDTEKFTLAVGEPCRVQIRWW